MTFLKTILIIAALGGAFYGLTYVFTVYSFLQIFTFLFILSSVSGIGVLVVSLFTGEKTHG